MAEPIKEVEIEIEQNSTEKNINFLQRIAANKSTSILLESKYHKGSVSAATRTALQLLVPALLYLFYSYFYPVNFIPAFIIFTVLISYLLFNNNSRFIKWKFYKDTFSTEKVYFSGISIYKYINVSSFQERMRLGTRGGREYIPNYRELAIWMKSGKAITFDELDYENFDSMLQFFLQKMEDLNIEAAPYRE